MRLKPNIPPCDRCHEPVDDPDDWDFDAGGVWRCKACGMELCPDCVAVFVFEPGYCGNCWGKPPAPIPDWLLSCICGPDCDEECDGACGCLECRQAAALVTDECENWEF